MLNMLGRFLRFLEVICIKLYVIAILVALRNSSIFYYYKNLLRKHPEGESFLRQCFIQEDQLDEWSGTLEAFSFIEAMVYLGYIFTLLLLMAKSRFMKTSIDNSEAFEETYMSYMCNKICISILSNPKIQKNPEIF